jgi:folate-binding protein YgfZ
MTGESLTYDEQYDVLRNRGGIVELMNWSRVTVAGADRVKFLNNFCTNDIRLLQPGDCCEAFFTNVKGKIVGHGLVVCRTDELVILGVPGQQTRLASHLERYVIREDVRLHDTTSDRGLILLAGGDAAGLRLDEFRSTDGLESIGLDVVNWNLVGSTFAVVLDFPSEEALRIHAMLRDCGFALAGEAFDSARIEAGVPLFMVDFDEDSFPQEVNRDRQAISFTKGCYLGQETVARIDALGHVNQRLVGVRFFGGQIPKPGMDLSQAGKNVGRVTSAAWSPRLRAPLALAMVRREANTTGARLESAVGAGEVVALPVA